MRIYSKPLWNSQEFFFNVLARNHRFQLPLKVSFLLFVFFLYQIEEKKYQIYVKVFICINITKILDLHSITITALEIGLAKHFPR